MSAEISESSLREQCRISCTALQWFIEQEVDSKRREIMLCDLLHKSATLPGKSRSDALARAFATSIPPRAKSLFDKCMTRPATEIREVDVAIITLKQPELHAAKIAFGLPPTEHPTREEKGFLYWEGDYPLARTGETENFVLTVVGEDRNVPCSNCVHLLLRLYRPKMIFLVGMAAGNQDKLKLGDVVVSELVIDYEGGRMEPSGFKKRPKPFNLERRLKILLTDYDPDLTKWEELFRMSLETLRGLKTKPHDLPASWKPKLNPAVILAGERLRADGVLAELRDTYHEQGITVDMESSGFAQACESESIPWLIFRGISDFGDAKTKDFAADGIPEGRKNWQPYASLAAACFARDFLANRFRTNEF